MTHYQHTELQLEAIVTESYRGVLTYILPEVELEMASASVFKQKMHEVFEDQTQPDPEALIVDLNNISFVDASGIGVLMGVHRRCQKREIPFFVDLSKDADPQVVNTFAKAGIGDAMNVVTQKRLN